MLCRSPLQPDETLSSYLNRLANLNRYVPFSIFTRLIHRRLVRLGVGGGWSSLYQPETFEVLEALTQTTSIALANASVHRLARAPILANQPTSVVALSNGQRMPLLDPLVKVRKLRRDGQAQFCPDCLNEAAYHHLSWLLGEVTTCLKHRCLLVDECPHCQGWIQIPDIVTQHCAHCDAHLARAVVTYLPDHSLELFAQQTIQAWWGLTETTADQSRWTLLAVPHLTLYRLFEHLVESIRAKWGWEYFYRQTPISPDTHAIQTSAFEALIDWPQGFWDFLREYLQRERALHDYNTFLHSAQKSLLAARLWDLSTASDFHFVQVALSQFLAENNFKIYFNRGGPDIYWPDSW